MVLTPREATARAASAGRVGWGEVVSMACAPFCCCVSHVPEVVKGHFGRIPSQDSLHHLLLLLQDEVLGVSGGDIFHLQHHQSTIRYRYYRMLFAERKYLFDTYRQTGQLGPGFPAFFFSKRFIKANLYELLYLE